MEAPPCGGSSRRPRASRSARRGLARIVCLALASATVAAIAAVAGQWRTTAAWLQAQAVAELPQVKQRRKGRGDASMPELSDPGQPRELMELELRWNATRMRLQKDGTYPEIERDPFFAVNPRSLLQKYLQSARMNVDEAVNRLVATAKWRKEWDVLEYYKPGVARKLFAEATNPGAEMYFADSLQHDREGNPYLAGRLRFANAENMHPWRHLRAGVLVFELVAHRVAVEGTGPASYILDIGSVGGFEGNVSGTAGRDDRNYDEGVNPYYKAGAGTKDAPSPEMVEQLGSLDSGFMVLKAAIQILNRHYPGFLNRVFYLNSDMLFWGAFKVFSRWISDRGSIQFSFLGPAGWREEPIAKLLDYYDAEHLFQEWGGTGPALDGDRFLERGIEHYEEVAASSLFES